MKSQIVIKPDCVYCSAINPVSSGMRWLCKKCGRQWNKLRNPIKSESPEGKTCKFCGSLNLTSHGIRWLCRTCHRTFCKISTKINNLEERPDCPYCFASNPTSRGTNWLCRHCNKYFGKHLVIPVKSLVEVRPV